MASISTAPGADPDEIGKLFVPIGRLTQHLHPETPAVVTQGYPSDPFLSADLDADIIIQSAYIRRSSYEEEDQQECGLLFGDSLEQDWDLHDIKVNFSDMISPLPCTIPLHLLAPALGLEKPQTPTFASPVSQAGSDFQRLLKAFDCTPNPLIATMILEGYVANIEAVLAHVSGQPSESASVEDIDDIINGDLVWTVPVKENGRIVGHDVLQRREGELPPEIARHLHFVLQTAQIDTLSPDMVTQFLQKHMEGGNDPLHMRDAVLQSAKRTYNMLRLKH